MRKPCSAYTCKCAYIYYALVKPKNFFMLFFKIFEGYAYAVYAGIIVHAVFCEHNASLGTLQKFCVKLRFKCPNHLAYGALSIAQYFCRFCKTACFYNLYKYLISGHYNSPILN